MKYELRLLVLFFFFCIECFNLHIYNISVSIYLFHIFHVKQEERRELDVFHIPFGNDNAILKGVELLLDKQKQHALPTTVVLSK